MSGMQDDAVGKAYDARLMRRLLQYLRPHVFWVAVAFLAPSRTGDAFELPSSAGRWRN